MSLTLIGICITLLAEAISAPYVKHGYKLYKENISWEKAIDACANGEFKEYGAHLVYISDEKEFKSILNYLDESEKAKNLDYIWIGAFCRGTDYGDSENSCYISWWNPGIEWSEELNDYWIKDEPSHIYKCTDGTVLHETYICLVRKDNTWLLNDVTNEFWKDNYAFGERNPKGKIGYLCEYADNR